SVGRRTLRVAKESIWVGIALSIVLMLIAAFGIIPAIFGALLQEVVDIVAIANSLRAMRGGRDELADFAVLQDSTAEARPQAGADSSGDPAGRRCPQRRSRRPAVTAPAARRHHCCRTPCRWRPGR